MKFKINLLTWAFCLFNLTLLAQPAKISPNDWNVFSENGEHSVFKDTTFLGKQCILMDGRSAAVAFKKGSRYKNVRVDCDIAGRIMSGIGFRAKDHQNYHFLYFRTGAGGKKEAIQYIPVYNGALSWVLYHYPKYEAIADIQQLQWFHATIEVRENVLRVFVNYSADPQLEVNLLESNFDEGEILLRSMFGETYFANIYVSEPSEILSDWQISEQFPRKTNLELDPSTKSAKWTKVKADAANIINIARYVENPNGVVVAKHALKAEAEKDMVLSFDFIGRLKIYLNGKEQFYYEKFKLAQIFSGTESIVLHLNKGDNELTFVSEGDATIFGKGFNSMGRTQHQNWGFIAEVAIKR